MTQVGFVPESHRRLLGPSSYALRASAFALALGIWACSVGGQDPVASFVQRNMQPGSAAFFVPSPIHRGEPVEAALQISAPSIAPEELRQELERLAGRLGVGTADAIRVAPRMVASLVTDRECIVTPKDPLDQAVDLREGAKWRWNVTPKVGGTIRATVTLVAPVIINGRETSYRVTSFEKTVTVTVTLPERASDALAWIKDNWVVLAAVGTGLGGIFAWLRRRRQRQPPIGFGRQP